MLHVYNGVLLTNKNKVMLFATTWMDLEIIILSEVRKRNKYHMISHMWNIKYDTNKPIKKQKQNRLVVVQGEERRRDGLRLRGYKMQTINI